MARQPRQRQAARGGATLAAGSVAAMLRACGGDRKKESTPSSGSTQSQPAQGTAAAAATQTPKRGGRLGLNYQDNTNNLNPTIDVGQRLAMGAYHAYDRLISQRMGKDTAKEYVPEAAGSVEQPDATTIIFKLKPGMKYHNMPPVGGRAVTADDVV